MGNKSAAATGTNKMKLRLALDWTPNSNHTGFYVGIQKGWYAAEGIDLEIQPPSQDYKNEETPARRVVNGSADLCVAPSESVISCWTSDEGRVRPVAVAAVLRESTSAIVSTKASGITSMKDLDSKRYASYGGRFEMNIINQMIKNNGGQGNVTEVVPPKLDCFDCMFRGEADATWIFMGWEGIQATAQGREVHYMPLAGSGVPYGYSPVLLAHPDLCDSGSETLRKFLSVTERGYQYAQSNPVEAAEILLNTSDHPTLHELGLPFLESAQRFLSGDNYTVNAEGRWGRMEPEQWDAFVNWLGNNELLTARDGSIIPTSSLQTSAMFTNDFLPR